MYSAERAGRSAEQRRLKTFPFTGAFQVPAAAFQVATCWIRSSPWSTRSEPFSIVHFETKAPIAPCARAMPRLFGSSWFMTTVNVPLPLSKAPRPSGIPTMRYGVPSGFAFTESPTVRIDFVTTPGSDRTTYGDCELLGPVIVFASAAVAAVAATTTTAAATAVRFFISRFPLSLERRRRLSGRASAWWVTGW